MAKTLLLMRHGKSSWKDKDIPDIKRPLKKRGAADSAEIGEVLKENELVSQAIFSSPALRASQTAEIVAKVSDFPGQVTYVDSFYMAEPHTYFEFLNGLDDALERVMIISHNPGLEAFLQILDGKLEALPTASLAYLSLDIDHWADLSMDSSAELIGFWDPEAEEEKEQKKEKSKAEKKDHVEKKEKKEKKEKEKSKKEKKEKKNKK